MRERMMGVASAMTAAVLVLAGGAGADVFHLPPGLTNLEFVTVGNPGNQADKRYAATGYGAVDYVYSIGEFEVTAGQYTAFLNAVAATDTYGLYNQYMDTEVLRNSYFAYGCNIKRSGSPGSYAYSVASDWANRPVNWVSWGDAARFANWLTNGQPTGLQDRTTTEDGSYYLNGAVSDAQLATITRKGPDQGGRFYIPTEDEWYKAAYYDPQKPGGAGYWDCPTRTNVFPSNVFSSTGTNNANTYNHNHQGSVVPTIGGPYWRTEVGAFAGSPGPYGTFDQGGNVKEWNEALYVYQGISYRGFRGEAFDDDSRLEARWGAAVNPAYEVGTYGFRVSLVPEPTTLLSLLGLAAATRRKRRK